MPTALVIGPPHTDLARQKGATVVVDYYKEGVKIIGPGTAVMREFAQKNPNYRSSLFHGVISTAEARPR
jgi:hypothetical protein